MESLGIRYKPENFESPLRDHMVAAYNALRDNNPYLYRLACADITNELKWSWKEGILEKDEADQIKEYFWGMSE